MIKSTDSWFGCGHIGEIKAIEVLAWAICPMPANYSELTLAYPPFYHWKHAMYSLITIYTKAVLTHVT